MKIDDLITELQNVKAKHGNIPCLIIVVDECGASRDIIHSVDVEECVSNPYVLID
jgi:hypothetical protein